MTVAEFPGPVLREVPPFRFTVPDGFSLEESPGSLAVLRANEAVGGFTANLLVKHDRIVATANLRDAAVITTAQLMKSVEKVEVTDEKVVEFPGRSTYIRAAKLRPEGTPTVLHQIHAIFFGPTPDGPTQTHDLFHLIGVCNAEPADVAEKAGRAFIEVVKTFEFTAPE